MKPVIYTRKGFKPWEQEELPSASQHFPVYNQRTLIPEGSLVIPRYSALPFYKELENDVKILGSRLLNTYNQHNYVADIINWYGDLENLTFPTWTLDSYFPDNVNGPFVLKGRTNSKKDKWNTHMFAKNKKEAIKVLGNLRDDDFIEPQGIVLRQYIPLVKLLEDPINKMPVTMEYRFFCLDGKILSSGFYWINFADEVKDLISTKTPDGATKLVEQVLRIIEDKIRFVVVDVALKADGNEWIVVELNDGQQSGISMNDPEVLYKNLYQMLISG